MRTCFFARTAVLAVLGLFVNSAMAVNGSDHRGRYAFRDASQKLIDNHGNGFDLLYGTRNVRSVLNGVYYRGGANNVYNRHHKRNNSNPLPDEGLQNLCEEGFSTAIYLYTTNYNTAPHQVTCRMNDGSTNKLVYKQVSILSASSNTLHSVLALMLEHIRNPRLGPIYAHCWNGWHASGLTATYALRQFCGFSAEQGVAYWNTNTDGNNGSAYNSVRTKIRNFRPFADLMLTSSEQAALCPQPGSLKFSYSIRGSLW
jgi:hypothetical protein